VAGARQKAVQADADRTVQLTRAALREGRSPIRHRTAPPGTSGSCSRAIRAMLPWRMRAESFGKLLERARAAMLAGKSGDADLALAKRWGADPKEVLAVQQSPLRSPGDPTRRARPEPQAPASPVTGLPAVGADAAHRRQCVILEFTVDVSGEPRDIHVWKRRPPECSTRRPSMP